MVRDKAHGEGGRRKSRRSFLRVNDVHVGHRKIDSEPAGIADRKVGMDIFAKGLEPG